MRRAFFYGWVVVAVTAVVVLVTAGCARRRGWIAILAGFAALAVRRPVSGLPVAAAPAEGTPAEASAT